MFYLKYVLLSITILTGCSVSIAQTASSKEIVTSAHAFLQTLQSAQTEKAIFTFQDEERYNWNFVPTKRNGLPMKELSAKQKEAALSLLKATLSAQGYQKAIAIMQLEVILKELENRGPQDDYRDPGKYYISIFGTPDLQKTWGWRLEGHHLALNFLSANGKLISSTPTFMGSNPGIVPSGPDKGKQILKEEVQLAFDLLHSLSESQKKQAIFSETALPEIVTGNSRKAILNETKGILFRELTKPQQQQLVQLVGIYVRKYHIGFADELMQKVETAGLDNLRFAWAGSQQWGSGHYYRIQGPTLLIEYDNTQNNGNHIHTSVRDLTNDFGEDFLKEHYQKEHTPK